MKIYEVATIDYDTHETRGLFSDREDALSAAEILRTDDDVPDIIEHEVDATVKLVRSGMRPFWVWFQPSGRVETEQLVDLPTTEVECVHYNPDAVGTESLAAFYVWADDEADAIAKSRQFIDTRKIRS